MISFFFSVCCSAFLYSCIYSGVIAEELPLNTIDLPNTNITRWIPATGITKRHKILLSKVAAFIKKKSKCNMDRRSLKSTDPLQNPARIMEAVGNPVDVSKWDGAKVDEVCGNQEMFLRAPEVGDTFLNGDSMLAHLASFTKNGGVKEASKTGTKFGTCELLPTKSVIRSSKRRLSWNHPLLNEIELAKSLSNEKLLLSETQIKSGKDDEVFSALSMVVQGSMVDLEIGTTAWHATTQGTMLWFALPPGQDLPYEAWQSFETWISDEMDRLLRLRNGTIPENYVFDPLTQFDPSTDDFPNSVYVFGLESHPSKNNLTALLNEMKICQQYEGDLIVFPENWRRWAIALEDVVLVSRRAGSGDTKHRKLRDRILEKAEESTTKEEAQKMAKDLSLLQKIEEVIYPKKTSYHVKTLMAKAAAYTLHGKHNEAAKTYRAVLDIDSTNYEAMQNLATCILAVQDNPFKFLQAEGWYKKVVMNQPKNGHACNALAGVLLELSKYDEGNQHILGTVSKRVESSIKRRYRLDALRFARQAVASVVATIDAIEERDKESIGRWHVTVAKALLNLKHGDVPTLDASSQGKREHLANGYLCKGIHLIKAEKNTWLSVRKRMGLNEYTCKSKLRK
jgi:tetratricopeptide (TPR) repeat protein